MKTQELVNQLEERFDQLASDPGFDLSLDSSIVLTEDLRGLCAVFTAACQCLIGYGIALPTPVFHAYMDFEARLKGKP